MSGSCQQQTCTVRSHPVHFTPVSRPLNATSGELALARHHTASFAALTGRALMIFRAGLALKTVGCLVNGLIAARSLVAGFLMTTNFAKPGSKKTPVFFSSL